MEVLEASADRVDPPCPELLAGCGGCDLQHATPEAQRQLKAGVVRDALARIGRLPDVAVEAGEVLATEGYRTVLRCGVSDDGRAGLRRRRSALVHPLERCLVAHPRIDEILASSRFPGAQEVTIHVGARTGDALVVVAPDAGAVEVPAGVQVAGVAAADDVAVHEIVGRRRYRVSGGSFFQARPDGAEALVRAVARAVGGVDPGRDRLADLYGGVGLFTGGLGARRSVLVERSASSVADAKVNLAPLGTEVVLGDVEGWASRSVDVVVADPPCAGLGGRDVEVVAATGADRVALVSCDPASLARDARGLVDAGYEVVGVELVDLFPHTHHLEAVTGLVRRS